MSITIKNMQSDEEIRGKAYVHWKAWQETYPGMMDQSFLDSLTLKKCEESAFGKGTAYISLPTGAG